MKKTMFITSVIMVVVMAIALTTSSLAWFTASGAATVTTSTLTLQAKVNSSAGLLICNDGTSFSTTSVAPTPVTGAITTDLRPVAPYSDTSVLDALAQNQFTGKTVDSTSGSNLWSSEAGYTDHYAGYIYVANAGDADINLAAAVNFSNVAGATLYVAVLAATVEDTDSTVGTTADWEIVRVASSNGTDTTASLTSLGLAEAAFATGAAVGALPATDVNPCASNISTTDVTARDTGDDAYSHWQKFLILAWYSADLTNYNSGATNTHGSFTVTFSIGA